MLSLVYCVKQYLLFSHTGLKELSDVRTKQASGMFTFRNELKRGRDHYFTLGSARKDYRIYPGSGRTS